MVVLGGGAVSYERGTPVGAAALAKHACAFLHFAATDLVSLYWKGTRSTFFKDDRRTEWMIEGQRMIAGRSWFLQQPAGGRSGGAREARVRLPTLGGNGSGVLLLEGYQIEVLEGC